MRFLVLIVAAGLATTGCSFDEGGLSFADAVTDDAPVIDAPNGTPDARIADASLMDAPFPDANLPDAAIPDAAIPDAAIPDAAPSLVDTGLIVRYFINEASSGQTTTELIDSAPSPINLPITYTPALSFAEDSGNRGLNWTSAGDNGRAFAGANGNKIRNGINGSQTATIEVVLNVSAVTVLSSRISHIGSGVESGECTLATTNANQLTVYGNNFDIGTFPVDLPGSGRIVVHAVVDTTLATAGNRTRLYVDGVEINNTSGINPILNDTFAIGAGSDYAIGNRANGSRSVDGTIYYAALYSAALTLSEVQNNAAVLLASDD